MLSSVIRQLRIIGLVEGVSFLLLLGIAMPLKYLAGLPRMVSVVGMIHGVLFVLYVFAVVHAWITARWPVSRALALLVASVLPFGTFLMDPRLKREQRAAQVFAAPT
jgi:integral membrane protein